MVKNDLVPEGMKIIHFERLDGPVLKTRLEELERVQDVFYDDEDITLNTFVNKSTIAVQDIQDYDQRIQFLDAFWKKSELDSVAWAELKFCAMAMTFPAFRERNRIDTVNSWRRITFRNSSSICAGPCCWP